MSDVQVLQGDALAVLKTLPAESVNCVVTSPPYFGLRAYSGGLAEIGIEADPESYVGRLVAIFREVRRVLRKDGTVWLNLGSSYSSSTIESDDYVLRDGLTDADRSYVYSELAKDFHAKAEALSSMRATNGQAERDVSDLLHRTETPPRELRGEGV